ncbi:hypothetical protein PR202_gb03952 [Eleusine coracana subsp. coracana]|uniref:RING-type domain-containing protein n=1 Tax=Eleusine coracana subsp. coracana TaxID=191504 RepID=A0AAV5E3B6_ELECO|nr:hypothetical protein PR202_gb03952 [Eleusine coracana subsp. coracana]
MNPNDAARRIPKRRRTSKSIVPLLDLNSPPAEAAGVGVPSSSMAVLRNQASSSVPPVANGPQIGLQSTPIDVETIDDDVMIYESRPFTQPPVIKAPPAPVEVVPREPKFTCPVCLNELTEPSSTSCGHIFCQKCIKASIQAQKKCPTCRQKLTNKGFHRVYLPTME